MPGSIFQRNTKGIYTLLRNDRTTLTENKNGHSAPKSLLLFVVSLGCRVGCIIQMVVKKCAAGAGIFRQTLFVPHVPRYSYLTPVQNLPRKRKTIHYYFIKTQA